jgi:ABC-2 type transport system ATP-binding protein
VPADSAVILVDGLTKSYGGTRAVDKISFEVGAGEVFALLGPNGAGKTTTVEILEGLRKADDGTIRVLGLDPGRQGPALKARIGVMLQEGGLYPAITPIEALRLYTTYYPKSRDPGGLLRLVGLESAARTRYRRLSGGQKRRLALALALAGAPELIFLDEPTTGMDPEARRATWRLIEDLRSSGVSIVLTTHYLEEAERLADRVAIMKQGRIVRLGTPEVLKQGEERAVRFRSVQPVDATTLEQLPGAKQVTASPNGEYVVETDDPSALVVPLVLLLRDIGTDLVELRVGAGTLEDVYLRLIGAEESQK